MWGVGHGCPEKGTLIIRKCQDTFQSIQRTRATKSVSTAHKLKIGSYVPAQQGRGQEAGGEGN
jgi:hypothetical protein